MNSNRIALGSSVCIISRGIPVIRIKSRCIIFVVYNQTRKRMLLFINPVTAAKVLVPDG